MVNVQQLSVVAGIALVAGAAHLADSRVRQPLTLEPPGVGKAAILAEFRVGLAPLHGFGHYYGDPEADRAWAFKNPFVPGEARKIERQELVERSRPKPEHPPAAVAAAVGPKQRPTPSELAPPPPPPPTLLPPPPPPVIGGQELAQVEPPQALGKVVRRGRPLVLVVHGDGPPRHLGPGEEVGGWILRQVEGGIAVFDDPLGVPHQVRIGTTPPAEINTFAGTGGDAGATGSGGSVSLDDPLVQAFLESRPDLKAMVERDPAAAQAFIDRKFGGRK